MRCYKDTLLLCFNIPFHRQVKARRDHNGCLTASEIYAVFSISDVALFCKVTHKDFCIDDVLFCG